MLVNPPCQCGLFVGTPYKRDEAIRQSYLLLEVRRYTLWKWWGYSSKPLGVTICDVVSILEWFIMIQLPLWAAKGTAIGGHLKTLSRKHFGNYFYKFVTERIFWICTSKNDFQSRPPGSIFRNFLTSCPTFFYDYREVIVRLTLWTRTSPVRNLFKVFRLFFA